MNEGLKEGGIFLHSHGALAQAEGGDDRAILMQVNHDQEPTIIV